jgi:predicted proteasome-type protease
MWRGTTGHLEEPNLILIDVESGDYAIGKSDLDAVDILRQKNPNARLFGIRIGYDVSIALGGAVMERIAK